jgi:membrane protease YdiL (CAAX protease family)
MASTFPSLRRPAPRAAPPPPSPLVTYLGLAIAIFGITFVVAGFRLLTGEMCSNAQLVTREVVLFELVAALLLLVLRGERLPLSSIGLRFDRPARSVARGLVLGVACLALCVALYVLLPRVGLHIGGNGGSAFVPSTCAVILMMARASVAEEICFRGYAIERLEKLTGSRWLAGLAPLVVFGLSHHRQGMGGIVATFALGGVLTVYYVKRRDLLANITSHFFVDMVLNVGLPLFGG